jgi:hypothetical protein
MDSVLRVPRSRAASPATARRVLSPQGVSSRSRLRGEPVLCACLLRRRRSPSRTTQIIQRRSPETWQLADLATVCAEGCYRGGSERRQSPG